MQYILVAIQIIAILSFDIAALWRAYNGDGFDFTPIQFSWFNPFEMKDFSVVAAGISLSIFMFWGWDVTLTMNEETKNPEKTPGRAATVVIIITIILYVLTAVAVMAWAGIGETGLGAGNPDNQESIFAVLSYPIMGPLAILIYISVLASSFASLQSTLVSPARTILAMSYYKALPPQLARISPRFQTPTVATIVATVVSGTFYAVTRVLSENALWDTIAALGLMICFYYGITAVACLWYFRKELFTSVRNFFFKFLFPLLGGGFLLIMFFITAYDSMDPSFGSGSSLGGVGIVFILGASILVLGLILMMITRLRNPDFFTGSVISRSDSSSDNTPTFS